MSEKAKMIFLVLTIGGTLCILASLGTLAYLYELNAAVLYEAIERHGTAPMLFFFFVGLPSIATFVAGAVMVKIGIQTGLNGDGGSSR